MNEKITPPNILNINFNLKSFIPTLCLITLIITQNRTTLEAKEPSLAIVKKIYSNSIQKLKIANSSYLCKAYGVISLDDIYAISKKNSLCSKSIDEYYVIHPKEKYFADSAMHVGMMYHVDFIDKGCLLHVHGERTLSELLLTKGLASLKKKFNNKEYKATFKRVQNIAKEKKEGIWSKNIMLNCLSQKQILD